MWETQVRSLGQEDPLEKEMATHSSILAWRIPWREEPGRLQSMGSQRVGHDWGTSLSNPLTYYRTSCFQALAVMGNGAINVHMKVLCRHKCSTHFGNYQGAWLMAYIQRVCLVKIGQIVFQSGYTIFHLFQPWVRVSATPHPRQHLLCRHLDFGPSNRCVGASPCCSHQFSTWCEELTHWKRPWCWERLRARREGGATEHETVGWHHRLNGHEFEQPLGDSEGQGSLACCSSWGCKVADTTERLNDSNNNWHMMWRIFLLAYLLSLLWWGLCPGLLPSF